MVSIFLALVSGIVLSGAFAPLNWWFLLPISVAIFLYAVTKTRNPFVTAFTFAAIFNFLTLKWTGTYVGFLPVVFLAALQSIFYLPLGMISFKRDRYSRIWLILPFLLIADEIRSLVPFGGFGWNRLSFSQADSPYISVAAFLGDTALSFIGISLGIALYLLFARAQLFSVAMITAATTFILFLPVSSLAHGNLNVLGVQGNVPKLGLDFNSRAEEVFNYHLKQTAVAIREVMVKPELIVWPENSVDIDPFANPDVGQKIADLATQLKTPIIVGAVVKSSKGPENVSIMWSSDGEVASKYVKRTLTPFGEYVPLRSLASAVSPFANDVVDFVPGNQTVLHKFDDLFIAPIICYEIIDDSAVNSISKESDLIIVQTNNATFADSAQSMQQLNIARIRAVESSKWVVSVSTTGVSAIVDNQGNIRQITRQNEPSYVSKDVELHSEESLANRLGQWTSIICISLSVLIYFGKRRRNV